MRNAVSNAVTSLFVTLPQRNGTPDPTRPDPTRWLRRSVVIGGTDQIQVTVTYAPWNWQ
jgi:hypothetical protein